MAQKLIITVVIDPPTYMRETQEHDMTNGDAEVAVRQIESEASFIPGFESVTYEFKEVPDGRN